MSASHEATQITEAACATPGTECAAGAAGAPGPAAVVSSSPICCTGNATNSPKAIQFTAYAAPPKTSGSPGASSRCCQKSAIRAENAGISSCSIWSCRRGQ
jgi:hypothetical protein